MTDIRVTPAADPTYEVEVEDEKGSARYVVSVTPAELDTYGGGVSPEALIEESFRFLLEREPKEAILSRFGLSVIERYFPEYRKKIRERLGVG
ncbi:MAG: hypothetical protein ACRELC_03870 [Gemmatimonadota bacterium]